MHSHPCAFCPWDCPSPEDAACGPNANEPAPTAPEPVQSPYVGACGPSWARSRGIVGPSKDVIRDLADYEPLLQPTAEAVDGP